jgi:uncharacterized YigZ family protein
MTVAYARMPPVPDHYRTLIAAAEARVKIERSEFLGIAFPIASEEAFLAELARVQKKHFDATHHCWAFRLFSGRERSSDAGEPSGTAGRPIAGAIESASLHDAAVVVVRWYGGIKLGTGGLARAYRECALAAVREAPSEARFVYTRVEVLIPFDRLSDAYRLVSPPNVLLAGETFAEQNVFAFDVRTSQAEEFRRMLVERRLETTPRPP